ncbi:hypothetical protein [Hydrocoleum sp. CS-953]|uniref:hypothetical protein n=1 Tax=Hydrocoleum sp. CS-953 TaxID=1671698 RepID=UPI00143D333B|nr:hypothetical protein [Hydrocoleum sp. CS-953]
MEKLVENLGEDSLTSEVCNSEETSKSSKQTSENFGLNCCGFKPLICFVSPEKPNHYYF